MYKVLVTGGAGTLGIPVVQYLLNDGNYEITVLDLKNLRSTSRLKKYRRQINIVYGDVCDKVLMDGLIKDHDYVIHLAGSLPPLVDLKENLAKEDDYEATLNIVRAINEVNPKCFLIYASTTTLYGNKEKNSAITTSLPCVYDERDYYSKYKAKTEEVIVNSLKNYTIFRLPGFMCNPSVDANMYHTPLNSVVELVGIEDAAYAFYKATVHKKELNKKIFNLSGGEDCRVLFRNHVIEILKIYGLSVRYLVTLVFVDKNFYGGCYKDAIKLEDILQFQNESLTSYYKKLAMNTSKVRRFIPKLLAKPFILAIKRK